MEGFGDKKVLIMSLFSFSRLGARIEREYVLRVVWVVIVGVSGGYEIW